MRLVKAALRRRSRTSATALRTIREGDSVTYGILPHPNDPNRWLMLLTFSVEENRQIPPYGLHVTARGQVTCR
jgi:hypothetical protein